MKYYIEIWHYGSIDGVYQSNNLDEVLEWYKENWSSAYDNGDCYFSVYENNKKLSLDEKCELGFI